MVSLFLGHPVFGVVLSTAPGGRFVGDVHVGRSKEILQRDEEARFQAATETDTETAGSYRIESDSYEDSSLVSLHDGLSYGNIEEFT